MDKVNSTKQAVENVQGKAYEELFDFFSQEHGLTLLYSQMDDIIHAVDNFKNRYNGDIEPQHKVTGESDIYNKPMVVERYADNGAHSHWELINAQTGETLWEEADGIGHGKECGSEDELWEAVVNIVISTYSKWLINGGKGDFGEAELKKKFTIKRKL